MRRHPGNGVPAVFEETFSDSDRSASTSGIYGSGIMRHQGSAARGSSKTIGLVLLVAVSVVAGVALQRLFWNDAPPPVRQPDAAKATDKAAAPSSAPLPGASDPSKPGPVADKDKSGKPVEMTPEIQKFGNNYLNLKKELDGKTPNEEAALGHMREMAAMFAIPEARGSFIKLVSELQPQGMPVAVRVFELPLDDQTRAFFLSHMIQLNSPAWNKAFADWLAEARDMAAIEKTLALYTVPFESTEVQKGLIGLLKGKASPQARWLALESLLEQSGKPVTDALSETAAKDPDERVRAHAAMLLEAQNPMIEGILVLDRKQYSAEKFPDNWPLQPGDVIQACDNVTYLFSNQLETALQKKPATDKTTLVFKRKGVDTTREVLVQDVLNELAYVRLFTARLKKTPAGTQPNF
jgi:hypothetical protein